MKTIEQINADIAHAQAYYAAAQPSREKLPPPVIKGKYKSLHEQLNQCMRYLETNPREDVVSQQLTAIKKEIKIINDRYKSYNPSEIKFKSERSKRIYSGKLFGLPRLKNQQITLEYLLSSKSK